MAGPITSPTLWAIGRRPLQLVPFTIGNSRFVKHRAVSLEDTLGVDSRRVVQGWTYTNAGSGSSNRTLGNFAVQNFVGIVWDTVDPSAAGRNVPEDTRDTTVTGTSRSYDDVTVQIGGVATMEAGEVIKRGQPVTFDAFGRAIVCPFSAVSGTNSRGSAHTNAYAPQKSIGIALTGTITSPNGGKGTTAPNNNDKGTDDWVGDQIMVLLENVSRL